MKNPYEANQQKNGLKKKQKAKRDHMSVVADADSASNPYMQAANNE